MQVKKLLTDDEGVSPVIGVILMVAITVILAAVIAAFVLGIGDTDDPAPNANIEIDTSEDGTDSFITLDHTSGDAITVADTQLSVNGDQGPLADAAGSGSSPGGVASAAVGSTSISSVEEITAGDSLELTVTTGSSGLAGTDDVEVQLIHAPEGDASNVYFQETVDVLSP